MSKRETIHELDPNQLDLIRGGTINLGIYRPGFQHKQESLDFFKHCVGEETYRLAMNSDAGREHHYAVARVFLNQKDWEKFVWIEEFGSLDGFPKH